MMLLFQTFVHLSVGGLSDSAERAKADLVTIRNGENMVAVSPHLAYQLAGRYDRKGDRRSALSWLGRAPINDTRQQWSELFSPDAAGLRADPAFFRKMADLGLARWWVTHNGTEGNLP